MIKSESAKIDLRAPILELLDRQSPESPHYDYYSCEIYHGLEEMGFEFTDNQFIKTMARMLGEKLVEHSCAEYTISDDGNVTVGYDMFHFYCRAGSESEQMLYVRGDVARRCEKRMINNKLEFTLRKCACDDSFLHTHLDQAIGIAWGGLIGKKSKNRR